MRGLWQAGVLLLLAVSSALAQQPTRPDTTRADSARAVADSLALVRELEQRNAGQQGQPPQPPVGVAQGATNPRMLPDISAVGDLMGDLSPRGSTQEDGSRFGVREVELAVQAVVDPYFRGDVFLGLNDLEKVSIEQAFVTTTSLPAGLELRLGRQLMPVGKQNETHRHDLHTLEYPWVLQRFLSPEGLKATGVRLSKLLSPFGFYQELIVSAVDRLGEPNDSLQTLEPSNEHPGGLGYTARLRNYWDLSQAANVELSFSGATARRAVRALSALSRPPFPGEPNAVLARQTLLGADLTVRWRPLRQGLYRSFLLQAEVMRQLNERSPSVPASIRYLQAVPTRDFTGAYVFARWQIAQRAFLGARADWLQDPEADGRAFRAGSLYYQFFPSEFSKINVGVERRAPGAGEAENRLLAQLTWSLGPHKPHPF